MQISATMMDALVAIRAVEQSHTEGVNSRLLDVQRNTLDALVARSLAVCNRGSYYNVSWVGRLCIEAYYVGAASKVVAA